MLQMHFNFSVFCKHHHPLYKTFTINFSKPLTEKVYNDSSNFIMIFDIPCILCLASSTTLGLVYLSTSTKYSKKLFTERKSPDLRCSFPTPSKPADFSSFSFSEALSTGFM